MKKVIGLGILVVALVLVFSLRSNEPKESIKLGAILPLTGGLATYGEPAQKVMAMVMDETNASGGIDDRLLEINFGNHKCDPKEAVSIYKQMKEVYGINIFTSAACSGTVLALAPGLEKDGSVWVGTVTTANKISGSSRNYFRNWATDATQARSLALALKKVDYKKVGAIYEETDYAKGLKIALEELLGTLIVGESFASNSTDVRTQIAKLKSAGVDVLFVSPQTVTTGEIVLKQMSELGFRPRTLVVNDNVMRSKELRQKYETLLEGAISADYNFDQSSGVSDMLARYKQKYGTDCAPLNVCIGAYDTIMLIIAAIENVGDDAMLLRDYIASRSYAGISGAISFDEKGDRKNAGYYPVLLKGFVTEQITQ